MRVLGLLQNPWFPPGTRGRTVRRYLYDDDFRRRVLARSWSGRRLLHALGEETFRAIVWDNASIEVGDHARFTGRPSPRHVRHVVRRVRPSLILTFSRVAERVVDGLIEDGVVWCPVMNGTHPNTMGMTTEEFRSVTDRMVARITYLKRREET